MIFDCPLSPSSYDPPTPPPNCHQDPTMHAQDCDHGGAVKLGRTSIMEIKILNDDGRKEVSVVSISFPRAWDFPV